MRASRAHDTGAWLASLSIIAAGAGIFALCNCLL
jgi:hypothetical protein